ncbi:hypothetical protein RA993_23140, partial [Mycobacteroides abscessus subsp. abscessus]
KGGRSFSVDLAQLDELREHHDWLAWDAIVPTTTARPNSQVVCASNAGDKRSMVLRSVRQGCLEDIYRRDTDGTSTGTSVLKELSVQVRHSPARLPCAAAPARFLTN